YSYDTAFAYPISVLISSSFLSPIIKLYSLREYAVIESSKLFTATLMDRLVTIPPNEITATSVAPPPISTIILPVGSQTGKSAPMSAAKGSAIGNASFAPASLVASSTALSSTLVIPDGTHTTILGLVLKTDCLLLAFFI